MLVLTRKPGERVVITLADGSTIGVEVLDVRRRDHVRLGIEANRSVVIDRAEGLDRPGPAAAPDPAAGPDYFRGVPK
jgi:carbon storage regulator CsrA